MTTLGDEVQERYSTEFLVSITNPQAGAYTTIDTDRLEYAVKDALAIWRAHFQGDFDSTDDEHLGIACQGVVACLMRSVGLMTQAAKDAMEEYKADLKALSMVKHRGWVSPTVLDEQPRYPRSAGRWKIPRRPNRSGYYNSDREG